MSRILFTAALVCAFAGAAIGPAMAEDVVRATSDDPMPVTSDTMPYCIGLAHRLDARTDLTTEARLLSDEGRHMCENGHVLGGLARLRRAMVMVRGDGH